ncbi:MogA/MoaB family molybdenum cofactor biosynthesis protein [Halocatena marina]|uniref:Molybdenum cofactor biosynthesis protein B n=1 Tax=Halocatena marina TaxID=2934937 RepID=A0ABD5YQ48_9EURY|nr:MogA/MoaB family molybdenum cofactor biosynthesis protein [Halocatena marina]
MDDSHDHHDHHAHDDHHDHDHGHHDHDVSSPGMAVLTISSSRTVDDDPAGDTIEAILRAADHRIVVRDLVTDEHSAIESLIDEYTDDPRIGAIITTGGTGVTPDDVTIEAVSSLFSKELPGFGELFRTLSYEEIGSRVVGTRATAGLVDDVPVFCLPGSENAVRLGTEDIIVHELPHLVGLAQRQPEH